MRASGTHRAPGMRAAWLAIACAIGLAGCATATPPKLARTTVVLMPDEDGTVGSVSVSTGAGAQKIDRAFATSTVVGPQGRPSEVRKMTPEAVDAAYRGLLAAQPPRPASFVLHFVLNQAVLTDESRTLLPAVYKAVRERKPTEITIFGHADATGTERYNVKLSAERARVIASLLRKEDPDLGEIDVQYFGDKVPLVPSDPRGADPKNRRAEIMIL